MKPTLTGCMWTLEFPEVLYWPPPIPRPHQWPRSYHTVVVPPLHRWLFTLLAHSLSTGPVNPARRPAAYATLGWWLGHVLQCHQVSASQDLPPTTSRSASTPSVTRYFNKSPRPNTFASSSMTSWKGIPTSTPSLLGPTAPLGSCTGTCPYAQVTWRNWHILSWPDPSLSMLARSGIPTWRGT